MTTKRPTTNVVDLNDERMTARWDRLERELPAHLPVFVPATPGLWVEFGWHKGGIPDQYLWYEPVLGWVLDHDDNAYLPVTPFGPFVEWDHELWTDRGQPVHLESVTREKPEAAS
jgi:hypothetical protein